MPGDRLDDMVGFTGFEQARDGGVLQVVETEPGQSRRVTQGVPRVFDLLAGFVGSNL